MSGTETTRVQELFDRAADGDVAARDELIGLSYERFRKLARKMMSREFPKLRNAHDSGSIVNRAAVNFLAALRKAWPNSVKHFLRLAAKKMREELTKLAGRHDRRKDRGRGGISHSSKLSISPAGEPGTESEDPILMAQWAAFHRAVSALPVAERTIVDLHWYLGVTKSNIAKLLDMKRDQVSSIWLRSIGKLEPLVPTRKPQR